MTTNDFAHEPKLVDEAIELLMRHRTEPDGPVSTAVIDAWRDRSPSHDAIWQRLTMIDGAAGQALGLARQKRSRRQVLMGGSAAVVTGLFAAATVPGMLLYARADHTTDKGQVTPFALSDGSTVTLGPQSAIAVDMTPKGRAVELLTGMALFSVAEAASPLTIRAGGLAAQCGAASVELSMGRSIELCVGSGQVDLVDNASTLAAGHWVAFDESTRAFQFGQRDPLQLAAWRDNRLFVDNQPLSDLVANMARWTPGQVIVADPFIGNQRISGVFDLSDPLRALRAAVHPAGGQVRQFSDFLTVISSV